MAEDLQGLLDRIQSDGFQKADAEREKIINDAKARAAEILANAQAQADAMLKKAAEDAAAEKERAEITVRQAARDIVIALKAELLERLRRVTKDAIAEAMTPAMMAQIVAAMAAAYSKESDGGLELILAQKDLDMLENGLKNALRADLAAKSDISLGRDFSAGIKVGFQGSDVFLDFSDEALSDVICEFVGPKLAAVLKG